MSRFSISTLGLCTLLLLGACSELFGPKETVLTFEVAPARVECMGMTPQECLQIRESPDKPWTLFYDEIEGFNFEPGFEYRIRVARRTIANPPADGSSFAYRLLTVLRKVPA
jgi:hypothetical protein